jgi:hypothetical protein
MKTIRHAWLPSAAPGGPLAGNLAVAQIVCDGVSRVNETG